MLEQAIYLKQNVNFFFKVQTLHRQVKYQKEIYL